MQEEPWAIWSISRRAKWLYFVTLFIILACATYLSWKGSSNFLELWAGVSNVTLSSVVVALYISEIVGGGIKVLASLWDDWRRKKIAKEKQQSKEEGKQEGAQEAIAALASMKTTPQEAIDEHESGAIDSSD